MSRFESLVAELARSAPGVSCAVSHADGDELAVESGSYLNEMPYCETASKPLFQTSVTSQALVADRRQLRKAETALPPTTRQLVVSLLARRWLSMVDARDGRGRVRVHGGMGKGEVWHRG